jgi:DNA-binding transcriptional MerR regulator
MDTALTIPNKSLFKMNEVCGLTGVKPYVLRFWEAEFDEIQPLPSSTGQKLYEHKDIYAIAVIKKMLFDEKMNIEQAKAEMHIRLNPQLAEEEDEVSLDNETYVHAPITLDMADTSVMREGLDEVDIEKLVAAKTTLNELVDMANDLKERHHWQ